MRPETNCVKFRKLARTHYFTYRKMVRCSVNLCKSSSDVDYKRGIRFYGIPCPQNKVRCDAAVVLAEKRRELWISKLNRPGLSAEDVRPWMKVCSRHFIRGKPAKPTHQNDPDWVPTLCLGAETENSTNQDSAYYVDVLDPASIKEEKPDIYSNSTESPIKEQPEDVTDLKDVQIHQVKEEPKDVVDFEDVEFHRIKEEPNDGMDVEDVQIHQVKEEPKDLTDFEDDQIHQVNEETEDAINFVDVQIHEDKEESEDAVNFEDVQIQQVKEELGDVTEFEEDWNHEDVSEEDKMFESAEEQKLDSDDDEEKVKPPLMVFVPLYEDDDNNVETSEKYIVGEVFPDLPDPNVEDQEETFEEVEESSSDAGVLGFEDYQESSQDSALHVNFDNSLSAASPSVHNAPLILERKWQQPTEQTTHHSFLINSTSNTPSECLQTNPDNFTQCPDSSHSDFQKDNIKSNVLIHTYICHHCDYSTLNIWALRGHLTTHSREKPFKCSQCNFQTKRQVVLTRHTQCHKEPLEKGDEKSHYKNRLYRCCQCPFKTGSKFYLSRHSLTHVRKRKNYKCPDCDFEGTSEMNLRNHKIIHSAHKLYQCSQCCYSAIQRSNLIEHMRIHTVVTLAAHLKERSYKCPDCDFVTTRKIILRQHRFIHGVYKHEEATNTRRKQHLKPRTAY